MISAVYFFMNQLPRLPTGIVGLWALPCWLNFAVRKCQAGCMLLFEAPDAPCLASGTWVPPRYEFGNAEF